jgi:sensor c-di-GMP phosphodiesterase-like protein
MPHMNGRFPYDVFFIILGPFVMIAASLWLTPLLMPDHVHHDLAVAITVTLVSGLAFTLLVFRIRRRRRRNT